jgi:hypothetical protein
MRKSWKAERNEQEVGGEGKGGKGRESCFRLLACQFGVRVGAELNWLFLFLCLLLFLFLSRFLFPSQGEPDPEQQLDISSLRGAVGRRVRPGQAAARTTSPCSTHPDSCPRPPRLLQIVEQIRTCSADGFDDNLSRELLVPTIGQKSSSFVHSAAGRVREGDPVHASKPYGSSNPRKACPAPAAPASQPLSHRSCLAPSKCRRPGAESAPFSCPRSYPTAGCPASAEGMLL